MTGLRVSGAKVRGYKLRIDFAVEFEEDYRIVLPSRKQRVPKRRVCELPELLSYVVAARD